MGRKFVLLGDIGTDHEGFPATTVISGSSTVLMDGKPIARLGDQLAMHAKPHHPPHPRTIAQGEPQIFIEGQPVALTGSAIDCGGVLIGSGSGEVNGMGGGSMNSGAGPASPATTQNAAMPNEADGVSTPQEARASGTRGIAPAMSAPGLTEARQADPKMPNLPRDVRRPSDGRSNGQNSAGDAGGNDSAATTTKAPGQPDREKKTLRLGVFFDGTGNNRFNDRQLPDRDITNVAKLHDLYRDDGSGSDHQRIYVPGVGTMEGKQTKEGYEAPEDLLGLGFGVGPEGGHNRIKYALNRVQFILQQGQYTHVTFDIVGFSRGAALARHFVNLINQWPASIILPVVETPSLMNPMVRFEKIAAFPPEVKAKVGFVGLFDTVGSFYWPGDESELDFNLDLAADSADRVVQLTAFHEIRKNFPLTSIAGLNGQTPGNFTEKALPGAHSDVGGGYENPSVDIRNYETFTIKTYQGLGMNGRTIRSAQQKVAALDAEDPRNIQMRVDGTDVIAEERRATRKELAIYALHKMYNHALESGVPFDAIDPADEGYGMPDGLRVAINQWKAAGGDLANSRRYLNKYIHTSYRERTEEIINTNAPEPLGQRRVFANQPGKAVKPQKIAANAR